MGSCLLPRTEQARLPRLQARCNSCFKTHAPTCGPANPKRQVEQPGLRWRAGAAWGACLDSQVVLAATCAASLKLVLICTGVGWLLRTGRIPNDTAPVLSKARAICLSSSASSINSTLLATHPHSAFCCVEHAQLSCPASELSTHMYSILEVLNRTHKAVWSACRLVNP